MLGFPSSAVLQSPHKRVCIFTANERIRYNKLFFILTGSYSESSCLPRPPRPGVICQVAQSSACPYGARRLLTRVRVYDDNVRAAGLRNARSFCIYCLSLMTCGAGGCPMIRTLFASRIRFTFICVRDAFCFGWECILMWRGRHCGRHGVNDGDLADRERVVLYYYEGYLL